MVSSLVCSTLAIKGVPIFPARIVEKPAFFKICSIREVVVVFPFEPVIPIKSPCRKRSASSSSLQMVTPLAHAACRNDQVLFEKCIFPVAAQLQAYARAPE